MNPWLWISRAVAATILGLLIFVSLLSYLLVGTFTTRLLEISTYTTVLNQQDTYNRVYDEVLVDPQLGGITRGIIGDIQLVSSQEIVEIVRRIFPPDELGAEVERNLLRSIDYLAGKRDSLDLGIDLRDPLPRVEIVIFEYIDRRIDQLDTVVIDPNLRPRDQLAEIKNLINTMVRDIANGNAPRAIPAIGIIPASLREEVFDSFLPGVLSDPRIDANISRGLRANASNIRREFVAGDTRRFLKVVARAGLTPLINQGIGQLDPFTDDQGQLDLISIAAANSDGLTEDTLRDRLDHFRDRFRRWASIGGNIALYIAVGATVVMFLIYLPSLINALRWPGLTLVLTGSVLFGLGKILERTLPRMIDTLVRDQISKVSDLPPAAMTLVNDLALQFTHQLVDGLANPALFILLAGGSLLGSSFAVQLLRPIAPWIR